MQSKATGRSRVWNLRVCVAAAAMLPTMLCAQPPQSRLPVGFPGYRGNGAGTPVQPVPAAAPQAPAAKPSAAIPASQLPAMPPTPPPPPPAPLTPAQKPAHRATVTYANGLLTVNAYNSSLNQILRAITRETGLVINGGVTDERVYGVYGPSTMPALFSSLFRGTASNILYLPAMNGNPPQLTLTPVGGGSPPPPPSASASDDLLPDPDDAPAVTAQPASGPQPAQPAVTGAPQPAPALGAAPAQPAASAVTQTPAVPAATPAAVVAPVPGSPAALRPGGAHTPEELVQQILQLRAAQQKMHPDGTSPSTPAAPAPAATPAAPPK